MNFEIELERKLKEVENIVKSYLPEESGWAKTVMEAMNYSVNVGGKRLRPMLMAETYKLFGGTDKAVEPFMAAIELIHTYSLVHDDLPAMDNDEYRRGKKTTWVVYGDAMAILAGDGLLNYAFETALTSFERPDCSIAAKAKALAILAKKAGIHGMIGGQTADIEAEHLGGSVTKEHLLFIHEHKTAALIQAAMMVGAVLADASDAQIRLIEQAAYEIGIAFQIQDDILDVTSSLETLGKPVGSDARNQKTTYVTLKGIEAAAQEQKDLSAHAIELLTSFEKEGYHNVFLIELIRSLITRER
ncbi:MAG: polyprenyl synthetase family protein [Lachnospiraceae bacterium]|nr:polyprenyl synthetase family protein [Lachnospiraceae bacterium]MDE7183742.1 polyprenyl synthetase family protein [Lachnospiraceae bacterium]